MIKKATILSSLFLSMVLTYSCNDSSDDPQPEPEQASFLCCGENPFANLNVDNLDQTAGEVTVFPYTTANGDGINDKFRINNLELYLNNTVTIFDLEDHIIYSADDYDELNYNNYFPDLNAVANGTIPIGT